MENGELIMGNGEWRMENGERRMCLVLKKVYALVFKSCFKFILLS